MRMWEPREALLLSQWEADFQPLRVSRNGGDRVHVGSPFSGWSSLAEGSAAGSMTFQRRVPSHRLCRWSPQTTLQSSLCALKAPFHLQNNGVVDQGEKM